MAAKQPDRKWKQEWKLHHPVSVLRPEQAQLAYSPVSKSPHPVSKVLSYRTGKPRERRKRNIMLIDTHSHLFVEEFTEDLPLVMERAQKAGVSYILCPI